MHYLTDTFNYTLINFCPANITSKEISLLTVARLSTSEKFYWQLNDQGIKQRLQGLTGFEGLQEVAATHSIAIVVQGEIPAITGHDLVNQDFVSYAEDDEIILLVPSPDSQLITAATGFRYFLISFSRGKFGGISINGEPVDAISVLGLQTD
jgi:hypothetical protein